MSLPIVAIVGRPNVGKSTLFNRLAGARLAIVEDSPGTTRDRLYADVIWWGSKFTLVDTGGLELNPQTPLVQRVREQVEMAIAEADVILFLVDGKEGPVPADEDIARLLRQTDKPVILVVNKVDNRRREMAAAEFYSLGLDSLVTISAYHGTGVDELMERVLSFLPTTPPPREETGLLRIAIVGRPNVGKSSFLNAILGQERAVVDEAPGTTRDSIDTRIEYEGEPILLIDTAGIRRRGRLTGVERYGVLRALRAIARCDVALLLMDAAEPLAAQDLHVAGYIHESYKGLVLVVNKWDLIRDGDTEAYVEAIKDRAGFIAYAPVVFASAKEGWGVREALNRAREVFRSRNKFIPPQELKKWLGQALADHPPPAKGPKHFDIFSVTQVQVNPPTFVFRVSEPRFIHFTYERYLENRLRERYKFVGTPLRLIFKKGKR